MVAALGAIEELDLEWLSQSLNTLVSKVTHEAIVGDGYASRMYRLNLDYAEPTADAYQPSSLILKLATDFSHQTQIMEHSVLFREVHFYRTYAPQLADLVPSVHVAEIDPARSQLTLLMQDLGNLPLKPWRADLETSLAAMKALAKVHARFWNADSINTPEMDLAVASIKPDVLNNLMHDSMAVETQANYDAPYLRRCIHHIMRLNKYIVAKSRAYPGPSTLVHGDFHCRNVLTEATRTVVYDWQVAERGPPTKDVAYWLVTSIAEENFHAFLNPLCDTYLEQLKIEGNIDYPARHFQRHLNDSLGKMTAQVYCFQMLVAPSEADADFHATMIGRAQQIAKHIHMLGLLRIMRVLIPPIYTVRRWLGFDKPPTK